MIGPPAEEIEEKIKSNEIRPLVLTLHPPERGYSVTLPGRNCVDCQTRDFSYDDDYELLQYVENCELPIVVIDLIERFCVGNVFYKGCVAVEVRDYREGGEGENSKMCYLRPTVQSLTDDLNGLLNDDEMNVEERKKIESSFWKLVSENLCFEKPSSTRSDSPVFPVPPSSSEIYAKSRKRRSEMELLSENELKSFKFVKNHHSSAKSEQPPTLEFLKPHSNSQTSQWKPMLPSTKNPTEIAEKRLANLKNVDLDDGRTLVEEYLIEFTPTPNVPHPQTPTSNPPVSNVSPADSARCNTTKIVISRRECDWVYIGELIVERNDEPPVRSNFVLGTEWQSKLYISQYLDMVSEGGRRSLTLTRLTPGKPPHVITSRPGANNLNTPNRPTASGFLTTVSNNFVQL